MHHYSKWEDYKNGFYHRFKGCKKTAILDIVDFFCNQKETETFMKKVCDNWVYSCEQNLTNPSINKVAYIGQSAICLRFGYPSTITMEAWSNVPFKNQIIANKLAEKTIKQWKKNYQQKLTAQTKIIFQ